MTIDRDAIERLIESIPPRRGWDFSRVRSHGDPKPWNYITIAQSWLDEADHVLDLDTDGGEKLIGLADHFGTGVGTDSSAEQIAVCRENLPDELSDRITFVQADAHDLSDFPDEMFDKVLNRHGAFSLAEVWRVLEPGGVFLTQQVGDRNTLNIFQAFGYEDALDYGGREGIFLSCGETSSARLKSRPSRPFHRASTTSTTTSMMSRASSSGSGPSRFPIPSKHTSMPGSSPTCSPPAPQKVGSRPMSTADS